MQRNLYPSTLERHTKPDSLLAEIADFADFGQATRQHETCGVPAFVNEFWTSRQRAASRLHEVSYRACFKPQLPRFFIERLTSPGERVHDPFMGRGTTVIEAALLGRLPTGCDVNPLSRILVEPRLGPPDIDQVAHGLASIDFAFTKPLPDELFVFYHETTLRSICALRERLLHASQEGSLSRVDRWIRMVAVNRLSGHSPGFFSVYTLPPNQAVSVASQAKINERRAQTPPPRDVAALILKKTRSLLSSLSVEQRENLTQVADRTVLLSCKASETVDIPDASVSLVVTSPPFLDVVQYAADNWLRCWFCGIDEASVEITMLKKLEDWQAAMAEVFVELERILRPGGWIAFEVGEVRGGKIKLEEASLPAGIAAGLEPVLILINDQRFTKTANCWGIDNNKMGTNTNRIVLFRKKDRPEQN